MSDSAYRPGGWYDRLVQDPPARGTAVPVRRAARVTCWYSGARRRHRTRAGYCEAVVRAALERLYQAPTRTVRPVPARAA